jgi:predicted nucleic acid-binding protein
MRCVVDASVVIKLFVDEELSQTARKLLEGIANPDPDEFYVPDLLFPECSNVLWKYVRFYNYESKLARENLADLTELAFQVVPTGELVKGAFEIAINHSITVYDACYVTLAGQLDLPLITADKKLVNHLEGIGLLIQFLGDLSPSVV